MIEIEKLTNWGAGREVRTQAGLRWLRKGPLTDAYRAAWRTCKEQMKAAGLTMGPVNRDDPQGPWEALWWAPLNGEVVRAREQAVAASRAVDARIDVPAPDGLAYMPFQRAGIAFMQDRPAVLLADQMGLGKTIQAIGVINADPSVSKVVVVCPASLKVNWRNELNRWLVRPLRVAVQNGGQPWCGSVADVVVVNYDLLAKFPQIYSTSWDMLVADECHYAKNRTAKRTKLLLGATRRADRDEYPGIRARRRVFMTGTPILNRPIELFPLLESLQPGTWTFRDKIRYCNGVQTRFGWDFSGAAHLDELQRRLRESVMIRRLKSEVLTELPAKRRQIVELPSGDAEDLCDEECSVYDRHQDEMLTARADMAKAAADDDEAAYREASERLKRAAGVAFSEVSRVRHQVALAKVPAVVEHVIDALGQTTNGKLVLFTHHLDVCERLAREIGGTEGVGVQNVHVVTGETPQADRQGIVDRFNSDPQAKVLILGIHAAGVGLSVRASLEVFAELDWVPGIVTQAEDRCHGIGRGVEGEPLLVQHLVLEGSLDARMVKILVAKQDIADRALDKGVASLEAGQPVTVLDADLPSTEMLAKEAAELEKDKPLHDAVLSGLKTLAGMCDGAQQLDGCGFAKFDVSIGHSLASRSSLTPKQVALGRRLCVKYRRQLPEWINAAVKGQESA